MMIEGIQERVKRGDYRFTIHAFERCVERDPTLEPDEWEENFKRWRRER